MPFRSRATLESWLAEFRQLGYPISDSVRVVELDGEDGATTGLVALALTNAATNAYIQPFVDHGARWVLTFESREDSVELDAAGIAALAAELMVISVLVAFLQAKSTAFLTQQP